MKRWLSIVTVGAGLLLPAVAWAGGSSHPSQSKPKHPQVVVAPRPVVRPVPAVVLKLGRQIDPGYNQRPPMVKGRRIDRRRHWYPRNWRSSWSKRYGTRVYRDNKGRLYYWCQPDSAYRTIDDCPYGRYDFGDPPAASAPSAAGDLPPAGDDGDSADGADPADGMGPGA